MKQQQDRSIRDNCANGYIMLSRSLLESSIWSKGPLYVKVFVYMLLRAQHKDYKMLKRGQLFTSIPEIISATAWYVGARRETATKEQVFNIINWLRNPDEALCVKGSKAPMITTTKATHGMLVTICKYDSYQSSENYESNDESNDERSATATRPQRQHDNINKNANNANNDNHVGQKELTEDTRRGKLYEMFARVTDWDAKCISQQVALFINKYPDTPVNKSGPLVNAWASNYRKPNQRGLVI